MKKIPRDTYRTPLQIIEKVKTFYDTKIDLDPAVPLLDNGKNTHATVEWNILDDALTKDWSEFRTIYINPPYSDILPWIRKTVETINNGNDNQILLLLLNSSGNRWFKLMLQESECVLFMDERISFDGKSRFMKGLLIVYFNNKNRKKRLKRFISEFSSMGEIVKRVESNG